MKKIFLVVLLLLAVSQAFAAAPRGYKGVRIKAEAAKFMAKDELLKAQAAGGNQQEMVMAAGQPYKPEVFVGEVYPFEDQNGKRAEVFVAVCEKGLKSVDIFVNGKKAITLNADFVKPVGKYAGVSVADQDMGAVGRPLLFDKRFAGKEVNLKFVFHMGVKSAPVEKTIVIPEIFEYISDITKAENGVDAVVSYGVIPMFDADLDGYAVADVSIGGIMMPQSIITKHNDPEVDVWYEVTTPISRDLIKVLKDMDAVMTTISFGSKSISSPLPYYSPYEEDYLP